MKISGDKVREPKIFWQGLSWVSKKWRMLLGVGRKTTRKGWSYAQPLEEREVSEFELKWRITLPDDYRAFLLRVGNGHLGNQEIRFGMSPLHRWCEPWDGSETQLDAETLVKRFDATSEADLVPGALRVCNVGCENYLLLVVTGRSRGEIWADSRIDALGVYPLKDREGRVLRFDAWIESIELFGNEHARRNDPRWN